MKRVFILYLYSLHISTPATTRYASTLHLHRPPVLRTKSQNKYSTKGTNDCEKKVFREFGVEKKQSPHTNRAKTPKVRPCLALRGGSEYPSSPSDVNTERKRSTEGHGHRQQTPFPPRRSIFRAVCVHKLHTCIELLSACSRILPTKMTHFQQNHRTRHSGQSLPANVGLWSKASCSRCGFCPSDESTTLAGGTTVLFTNVPMWRSGFKSTNLLNRRFLLPPPAHPIGESTLVSNWGAWRSQKKSSRLNSITDGRTL